MTIEHVLAQLVEDLEQLQHHGRRQSLERLVQQQQLDVAGQRARHRHHLLLAARQIVGRDVHALFQAREHLRICSSLHTTPVLPSVARARRPSARFSATVMPANRPRPCGT